MLARDAHTSCSRTVTNESVHSIVFLFSWLPFTHPDWALFPKLHIQGTAEIEMEITIETGIDRDAEVPVLGIGDGAPVLVDGVLVLAGEPPAQHLVVVGEGPQRTTNTVNLPDLQRLPLICMPHAHKILDTKVVRAKDLRAAQVPTTWKRALHCCIFRKTTHSRV